MKISDYIALISFLVAILSAIYTRRTWRQAKHSNNIATHEKRIKIYRSFDDLSFAIQRNGSEITHDEVGKFYNSSRDSEFYFNTSTHNKLKEYYNLCFKLAELQRKKSRDNYDESKRKDIYKEQDKLFERESKLSEDIYKVLRSNLKLNKFDM